MRQLSRIAVVFLMVLWAISAHATVSNNTLKSGPYLTDGNVTVFNIVFQFLEDVDINVQLTNLSTGAITTLVQNSDYTVTDGTPPADDGTLPGGSITIEPNAAGIANGSGQFPAGYSVTIIRSIDLTQQQSYPESGVFPSAATEQALDRLTIIAQQQQNILNNTIQFPSTDNGVTAVLPPAATRANQYLSFTSSGNVTVSPGTIGGVSSLAASSPLSLTSSTGSPTISLGTVPVAKGGTALTAAPTNGQLLIGNGTGYTLSTISAGSNIIVTNTAGGIQIAATTTGGGGSSNLVIGSTTTANPQVSGQNTSGFYALGSTATSAYGAEINGSKILEFENLASSVDYLTVTPGKSGTVPLIAVNGSTANQSLNITATGTGQVQIKGIAYPSSVTNNYALAATSSTAIAATPVSTLIDNGIGSTAGSVLYRTATSWQPLADSTSGYVLTAQGAGVAPVYAALPSATNGTTLLATVNPTAQASVVFNATYITSAYNKYSIECDNIITSAPDALQFVISTNNGSGYLSANYLSAASLVALSSATRTTQVDTSWFDVSGDQPTGTGTSTSQLSIKFSNPAASKNFNASWSMVLNGAIGYEITGSGVNTGTTAINAVKIVPASGTITANCHLYGLAGT